MRARVAGVILALVLPLEVAGSEADVPLPPERPTFGDVRLAQSDTAPPLPQPRPDRDTDRAPAGGPPLPQPRPGGVPLPAERPAGSGDGPSPTDTPGVAPADSGSDAGGSRDAVSGTAGSPDAPAADATPADGAKAAEAPASAGPSEPPDHTAGEDEPSQPPPLEDLGEGLSPACPAIEEARVSGRPLPPVRDSACPVPAIYAISFVGSSRSVRLEPEAVVNCAIAERLDEFVERVVEPAAVELLDASLATLHVAGSYVCRTRNGEPDTRPSEHGLANAIDISAFELADGRIVAVGSDWTGDGPEGEFLRRVHAAACGPFTTVLGPEADAFHQDHLHLDLQRRGADGRTTFCQ